MISREHWGPCLEAFLVVPTSEESAAGLSGMEIGDVLATLQGTGQLP